MPPAPGWVYFFGGRSDALSEKYCRLSLGIMVHRSGLLTYRGTTSHKKMHPFPFFQKISQFKISCIPLFVPTLFPEMGFFLSSQRMDFSPCIHVFLFFEKKISAITAVPLEKKSLKRLFFVLAC